MSRVIGLLFFALVAAGCSANQSADRGTPTAGAVHIARNPADELVRRVQDVYRNQDRLSAVFRQNVMNKTFGLPSVNDGRVYLKKPGKMRWDYLSKRDRSRITRSLICDGTMMYAVDIAGKWYYQQNLAESLLPVAVSFWLGKGDLAKEFSARLLTDSKHGATGDKVLELTPKNASAALKSLVLVVDPADFRVRKSITTTVAGDTNAVSFYRMDTTRPVADSWFVFNPTVANARGFRQMKAQGPPPTSP